MSDAYLFSLGFIAGVLAMKALDFIGVEEKERDE